MQSLKRILIATGIVLLVMLFIGFLLPGHWEVERSILIHAPSERIFPYLNNLKSWREWAAWYQQHPKVPVEYSGPDAGVGATVRWTDEHGRGALKILGSLRNRSVEYQILFNGGISSTEGELTLIPESGGTRVLWQASAENGSNPANHYLALMLKYQISQDFDESLERLKQKIESPS